MLPVLSASQNIVRVPPFTGTNYINDFVIGDTLANGARRDSNAVYVLSRGAFYLANAPMRNTGWTMRIRANDTTAGINKPIVYLYPNPGTGLPPGQFVDMRGSVIIKNVIIDGTFEPIPANLSLLQGALFNTTAAGLNLSMDSCMLLNVNGNLLRTDQAPRTFRITNTIFANMGYLGRSNLGAGKAIDVRGGSVDSLIMINNTFVNWQDRIIRHFASTANINYLRFEHNTCVNGMSYHGFLSLGRMGRRGIIRDNLLIDAFAAGQDTDAVRQAEFTDSGELDQFGFPRMTWVIANPSDSTQWTIKNNYYRVTPVGQSFYDSASILPIVANPALTVGRALTYKINSLIGADSVTAFLPTNVTLPNTPRVMDAMMKWYRRPAATGAGKTKGTGNWAAEFDMDRRSLEYFRDTLNCTYSNTHALYTAASCGYPVGDLNWFPARYTAWRTDPCVDISLPVTEDRQVVPTAFELGQNYPNPFNPATKITYVVPSDAKVKLEVFDMLGRRVATLFDGVQHAGTHVASFDAASVATGVYLYRLSTPSQVITRKMVLMK
jgi:hypothetical protein